MAIPDYQTVMLPLLNLAADAKEHRFRDAIEELAVYFNLTEDERKELAKQEKEIEVTYSKKIAEQFREFIEALGEVLDKKELKDPNTGNTTTTPPKGPGGSGTTGPNWPGGSTTTPGGSGTTGSNWPGNSTASKSRSKQRSHAR